MATAVRSVRFSEDLPTVAYNHVAASSAAEFKEQSSQAVVQLPRVYDDTLYSPYDVYTAASMGDTAVVEVKNYLEFAKSQNNFKSYC